MHQPRTPAADPLALSPEVAIAAAAIRATWDDFTRRARTATPYRNHRWTAPIIANQEIATDDTTATADTAAATSPHYLGTLEP